MTRIARGLLLLPVLVLTACATVPPALEGEFTDSSVEGARSGVAPAAVVRWGGEIVSVDPKARETCFEILARPLDRVARPRPDGEAEGRFIACHSGFHDPMVWKAGREMTVTGRLDGTLRQPIGEFEYTYPKVAASAVHLWPERIEREPSYIIHGTYWGSPFFYHPYPRVIHRVHSVPRKEAAPGTAESSP